MTASNQLTNVRYVSTSFTSAVHIYELNLCHVSTAFSFSQCIDIIAVTKSITRCLDKHVHYLNVNYTWHRCTTSPRTISTYHASNMVRKNSAIIHVQGENRGVRAYLRQISRFSLNLLARASRSGAMLNLQFLLPPRRRSNR